MQKIKAEMLIEQIRTYVLPFCRTFGDYPVNNIGNNAEVCNLLKIVLICLNSSKPLLFIMTNHSIGFQSKHKNPLIDLEKYYFHTLYYMNEW